MLSSIEKIALEVQELASEHLAKFQAKLRDWVTLKKAELPVLGLSPENDERDEIPEAADDSLVLSANPSRLYRYALLAAISDSLPKSDSTVHRLDPWWLLPSKKDDELSGFGSALMFHLRRRVNELKDDDVPRLRMILSLVTAELTGRTRDSPRQLIPHKRGSGGRKRTRDVLDEMILDPANVGLRSQQLAAAHNRRYPLREPATAKIVNDRRYKLKQASEQNHNTKGREIGRKTTPKRVSRENVPK